MTGKEHETLRALARRGRAAQFVTWLGDCLPDPVGSWLLRVSDDSEEPWTDAEGRLMRP